MRYARPSETITSLFHRSCSTSVISSSSACVRSICAFATAWSRRIENAMPNARSAIRTAKPTTTVVSKCPCAPSRRSSLALPSDSINRTVTRWSVNTWAAIAIPGRCGKLLASKRLKWEAKDLTAFRDRDFRERPFARRRLPRRALVEWRHSCDRRRREKQSHMLLLPPRSALEP